MRTVVTEDKSVIDFPMDGAPSEGCSTTTILAQLSIEPDAGAGAVHTITLISDGSVHMLVWAMKPISYARHRFPPDVIQHTVAQDSLSVAGCRRRNSTIGLTCSLMKDGPNLVDGQRICTIIHRDQTPS